MKMALYSSILLLSVLTVAGIASCIKHPGPAAPTGLHIMTPAFKAHQCFLHNDTPRESWEPVVDGIIEKVGVRNYLVLPFKEADKRSGDKMGVPLPIEEFDAEFHQAVCPDEWLTHTHSSTKEAA